MTQNRDAPAFQEYAATMMAKVDYRTMSLAARGLLYTMRLECWVNRQLPADAETLARILGFDSSEVRTVLPDVMSFFDTDGTYIYCPELDDYRAHLEEVRKRQSEGGRKGARRTNAARAGDSTGDSTGDPSGEPSGILQATRRVARESSRSSLVQPSKAKSKSNTSSKGAEVLDDFIGEYNAYEEASRGA